MRESAYRCLAVTMITGSLAMMAREASAQPLGTFRWQSQPNCNVLMLNVVQQGGTYMLDGYDDQCGAGQRASATGTAFLNPDGTVGIGLTIVASPSGTNVHLEARISTVSLGGPWNDSAGNSGTFVFTPGAGTGGSPRRAAVIRSNWFTVSGFVDEILDDTPMIVATIDVPEITASVINNASVQVYLRFANRTWLLPYISRVGGVTASAIDFFLRVGEINIYRMRFDGSPIGINSLEYRYVISTEGVAVTQ